MRSLVFSLQELREYIERRRDNKFSMEIVVSGARGNGKSTFLFKLLSPFKEFNPRRDIVYKRSEVIKLLERKRHIIMDDEAIRTGYKRNFFDQDQKTLIQMLNMYRNNLNVYCMAIPNFYSLDRGVRDLIKMHIHITERGLGVIHVAQSSLYSDDVWDVNYNKKVEERWAKNKKRNPNFKYPYHKLTTFLGYIKFGDITEKQRKLYEDIKETKRQEVYDEEMSVEIKKEDNKYDKLYVHITTQGMSKKELMTYCLLSGLKYSLATSRLNQMLKDNGIEKSLKDFLLDGPAVIHNSEVVENLPNKPKLPVI